MKVMEVAVPSVGDPLLYDRHLGVLALHMDMVDCIPPSTVLQLTCKIGALKTSEPPRENEHTVALDGGGKCHQGGRVVSL